MKHISFHSIVIKYDETEPWGSVSLYLFGQKETVFPKGVNMRFEIFKNVPQS